MKLSFDENSIRSKESRYFHRVAYAALVKRKLSGAAAPKRQVRAGKPEYTLTLINLSSSSDPGRTGINLLPRRTKETALLLRKSVTRMARP